MADELHWLGMACRHGHGGHLVKLDETTEVAILVALFIILLALLMGGKDAHGMSAVWEQQDAHRVHALRRQG